MIVVTGGTGLVGSHLLLQLAQNNVPVRALKRSTSDIQLFNRLFAYHQISDSTIEWVDGDLTDLFSLESIFQNATHLYHCAAMISFYPHEAKKMLHINIEGTANVVDACLKYNVQKLCYVSSVASLGRDATNTIIDEETHWEASVDNSNYAISKYGAEREVWRGIAEGLNAVIVNPSIIIGAGDWTTGSSNMIRQVWKGLRFYTNGCSGFVDVRDVCEVMIQLMNSDTTGERFILNGENKPFREFFKTVATLLNKREPTIYASPFLSALAWKAEAVRELFLNNKPLITKETARSAHKKYFYSNAKIKKALGYEFLSVNDSLHDVCLQFLAEHK